jgi:hypothetical protein
LQLERQRPLELDDAVFFVSHVAAPCSGRNPSSRLEPVLQVLWKNIPPEHLSHLQNKDPDTRNSLPEDTKERATISATFDLFNANRVDRLRLGGNGVVPATAAKAYFTLNRRMNG